MIHGSLFSGQGGFDLAAQWMGWENAFHCEINPFCQRILKYYWPDAQTYTDIKATDFTVWRGRIDILTGGFPCQPYGLAGERKGKEDERHLWPEMHRAIREIQPAYVVAENVRGLINWNGGMVFDEVQIDLENEGYEVIPFLLPACGVNADHERFRIWFVAHSYRKGLQERVRSEKWEDGKKRRSCAGGYSSRTHSEANWGELSAQSAICTKNDGIPRKLDGITFSKWRNESIKAAGNAIVPQVVYQIFQAIQQIDE